ncbi:N-acetylmuramoyl-L-alanine amidase [Lyngbya confervoides]|uniref:N-acetylmuramoyl-L-alanine amidase n=1 Tax=Lyngbya confervoides BDU141951 TaxID=1574623 RepID=A0ABD4T1T5_9CYAN|nr:peptidoglycan recognition family protein [Lyngbya confervoides]MCM1982489.1 peptidoglycan recognition protein family protein [Lyngbya confervoides BDU141951]
MTLVKTQPVVNQADPAPQIQEVSAAHSPALQPVMPAFRLSPTLPTITPEETRSQSLTQSLTLEERTDWEENLAATSLESVWDQRWDFSDTSLYSPEARQYRLEIDPSNYGDRMAQDVNGNPAQQEILVVLHETTSSAESAIHTFLTPHPRDEDQVSYHALILLDGRIVHLVPPEKRAYGAGNSEFPGPNGPEAVQTNPNYPSSVNNFAYHISLETPLEAQDKPVDSHLGYTFEQYDALAWLIRQLEIDPARIALHRDIDRELARADPRSFDRDYLLALLY